MISNNSDTVLLSLLLKSETSTIPHNNIINSVKSYSLLNNNTTQTLRIPSKFSTQLQCTWATHVCLSRFLLIFNNHCLCYCFHFMVMFMSMRTSRRELCNKNESFERPKGYVPVIVGDGEKSERFMVALELFRHPFIVGLLQRAAEEFGYDQRGVIRLPCDVELFRQALLEIS